MLQIADFIYYFCPMNKELIKSTLINARNQFLLDIECARRMAFVFGSCDKYNNDALYKSIIELIVPFCSTNEEYAVEIISNFIFLNTIQTVEEITENLTIHPPSPIQEARIIKEDKQPKNSENPLIIPKFPKDRIG